MKKYYLVAGCLLIWSWPGRASVVACYNPSSETGTYSAYSKSTWGGNRVIGSATCGLGINGQSIGATSNSVAFSETDGRNKYCFCRVMTPVVSAYRWSATYGSENECWQNCVSVCANLNVSDFNNGIFFYLR